MLLERDSQLAALHEQLRLARVGTGSLVLIGGEAGAGKTSLIAEFTSPLGKQAVIGACDPLSAPRALSPLRDFVDVGDGGNIDLFGEVLDRFGRSPEPTVMVLEDVHWADQATLDFVRFAGRRVGECRMVVLCTFRDDEVGVDHPLLNVLGQLARLRSTVRLNVPALSVDAVRTLAAGTALDPDELHELTGGNAFYVTELVAAGGDRSVCVHDAVLARVNGLPHAVRSVIETISIAPRSLDLDRTLLLGHDAADIDDAISSGVVLADGKELRFRHELARSTVHEAIPPARCHERHRAMLDLLLAEGAPDHARLAHHAIEANAPELIAAHAPAAAREAHARRSAREAVALFSAALDHPDQYPAAEVAGLQLELGSALIDLERPADALAHLDAAHERFSAIGDLPGQIDARRRSSRAYEMLGRPADAMRCAREALDRAEPLGPSPRLVLALNSVAGHFMLARRAREGRPFSERAATMARTLGLHEELLAVEHTHACLEVVGGDVDHGLELLAKSVDDLGPSARRDRVTALGNLGSGAGEVRRYDVAIDALVACEALGVADDNDAWVAYARAWLARVAFEQGRWDDAAGYAALVDETTTNRQGYSLLTALGTLGRVRVRRGDPGGATLLEQTLGGFRGHELQYRWSPLAGLAEHHWLAGDRESMVDVLAEPYQEALATDSEWAQGELGYWLWKAGALDAVSPRASAPFAAQIDGDTDRAVALWERTGCPYEEALARSEGPPEVAVGALSTLDGMGAAPLAARVRSELRAAGFEGIPRGPSTTTRAHPLGLTARQAEVLELVVEGLSNAEIATRLYVSKKTVEHHVSAVYAKLGVETRAQAIASALG